MSQLRFLEKLLEGTIVEWKMLGEVGNFVRGSGIQKSDFTESGTGCIHYGQIHTHYGTWADKTKSFINHVFAARLRKAHTGDLVIATTSEDDDALAKAVAWLGNEEVAVSTDAYIYRHTINPKYMSYFFQTELFQSQKKPYITGTKVRRISGESLAKIQIPIPPLPVQVEIVRILDAFTELTAELTARKKQYNYYRDQLLSFEEGKVEWKTLGGVAEIRRGTAITEKETTPGNVPVIANAPNPIYFHNKSNRDGETIVIARSGAYAGLVSYWNQAYFLTDAFSIHADDAVIKPKFVYHLLKREQEKIHQMSKGGGVPHVRARDFEAYQIPIPPLAEQKRIVAILDKFDALTNSISEGLPREIELRQKQYEYYRELLLSFPKPDGTK
ncbi:restriction endonuclease subunit S [Leptospira santarosai serovar Bananal]|nr:restriction endonuclease subunit S [Leptospira santarosai]OLY65340.1 restriction endonuclease subunit S [Leptospira santarosai serovar Grippotyphosa]ONF78276.1 restriction endonuclease subunit S [Leptospira santarosai serovar Bananal]